MSTLDSSATLLAVILALGACRSSSSGTTPDAPVAAVPAAAFFRGTLAMTVDASKAFSDPFFTGVEAEAMGAGDDGHDALLGTTHLGTTLDQFVGLDTWSSDANMDAVYADPHVASFGAAFYAAPPEFATFRASELYQWGNPDAGDASTPHYFVMIRGRLHSAPDGVRAAHDALEQGAEAQATSAGQVAHLVYTGRQDAQDALMVDIWTTDTGIDAYYTNATFESSLAALFDATGPNYGVYGSTDWVTW